MIELKNVSKYYNAHGITNLGLRNINLTLSKNEIVAITGDSGSGKSTLLNVISKIDSFDDGEIFYRGNETSYFSINEMDDFRKNKVGFIFQNYNIIDSYTVLENVMVPLLLKGETRKKAKEMARHYLAKVGLSNKAKNRGSKLSGGEKQRCVIARALASDCEILACDEPTGNLDSKTGEEIIALLKEVSKDKLVLIVTHDYALVEKIATRKIKMHDGEIIEDKTFIPVEPDEDFELDLDYKPLKRKIDLQIAYNNVLFTPKKTVFVSLIFMAIFTVILVLFALMSVLSNDLVVFNSYNNMQTNRLYVYTKNHAPIDESLLAGYTYEINPFNEDVAYTVSSGYDFYLSAYYNDHVSDYTEVAGVKPTNENELYLIFPSESQDIKEVENYIGKSLDLSFNYSNYASYKLSGYATSKQVNVPIICFNEKIKDMMNYYYPGDYTVNDETYYNYEENVLGKTILYVPVGFEVDEYVIYYTRPYRNINCEIIEDASLSNEYDIYLSYDPRISMIEAIYEVSIYTDNINKAYRDLTSKGLLVDIPCELVEKDNALAFIMNLTSYLMMFASLASLWLMFIITYLILAKVYNSRKKDYEILRTLGITKRDMKKVLWYEVVILGVSALILAFGLVNLMFVSFTEFKGLLPIPMNVVVMYVLIGYLLMVLLTRLFNKRLFKFTVSSSLKGDDYFD